MSAQEQDLKPLIVFDFGKTNIKIFIIGPDLSILYEEYCPPALYDHGPYRVLDTNTLWQWMQDAIGRSQKTVKASGIIVTTHGSTGALIGQDKLIFPILDYEAVPPQAIQKGFKNIAPTFKETLSPTLPANMNLAQQIFWLEETMPEILSETQFIIPYPQFWGWKLGAPPLMERTSLGCHTQLWAPQKNDFSTLVYKRGWDKKFPKFAPTGAIVGKYSLDGSNLNIHNGVHDSNASLYLNHLAGDHHNYVLVTTGTWIVIFNPNCPLKALKADRDMMANVAISGEIIPTARFMGGREFDILTEHKNVSITQADMEQAIQKQQYALPTFTPSGPFPQNTGRFMGPEPESIVERTAIGLLYLACMTTVMLDLLQTKNQPLLFDGDLSCNALYTGLVAALLEGQPVLQRDVHKGTATGAASLAYEALGYRCQQKPHTPIQPLQIHGLLPYYQQWRILCNSEE